MSNVQPPQTAGDFAAFTELRARAGANASGSAREAARQFEALFTQQMLQSMRAAGDVFGDDTNKSYRDMFDQQIAMEISKGKGLGLADMLTRQLGGTPASATGVTRPLSAGDFINAAVPVQVGAGIRGAPPASPPVPRIGTTPPEMAAPDGAAIATDEVTPALAQEWRPAGPLEFLRDLAPYAEKAAGQLGVSARAILAHAALETGWGQNVVRSAQGVSSNNLFNIKAGAQWVGDQVRAKTLEFVQGVAEQKNAAFRAYPNLGAAFDDYVKVLGSNPRYAAALRTGGDASQFAGSLQKAGYATDPAYAEKLRSIMGSPRFESLIGQLKKLGNLPMSF